MASPEVHKIDKSRLIRDSNLAVDQANDRSSLDNSGLNYSRAAGKQTSRPKPY